jgi:hypothetical protein
MMHQRLWWVNLCEVAIMKVANNFGWKLLFLLQVVVHCVHNGTVDVEKRKKNYKALTKGSQKEGPCLRLDFC